MEERKVLNLEKTAIFRERVLQMKARPAVLGHFLPISLLYNQLTLASLPGLF